MMGRRGILEGEKGGKSQGNTERGREREREREREERERERGGGLFVCLVS